MFQWRIDFLGIFFIDSEMEKWWRKSIVKCILWWNLTVRWVISSDLVFLLFIQNSNDSYRENYGEANLCYLCYLPVSLLFCIFTFLFSPMEKWCNCEMIPDGAVMLVRQFCCDGFSISNFLSPRIFPWTISGDISLLRITFGRKIILVDVPG